MMEYIVLPRMEWGKVLPMFEENGTTLPETGMIAAAMDGPNVGAFLCLQPALHAEPIWIDRPYRGKINFVMLHRILASHMPQGVPYYAFAPNRKISRMAEICGLEEKSYKVWQGVF